MNSLPPLVQLRVGEFCDESGPGFSPRVKRSLQHVGFRVLSPVMTFNLYAFEVNLDNSVSLNTDELAQLVQAWPELGTFCLNRHSGWGSIRMPTVTEGPAVARRPKLRNLGMSDDARNIPSLTEGESSIRNTAITRLVLANSPIGRPVTRVVQFLLADRAAGMEWTTVAWLWTAVGGGCHAA